MSVSPKVWKRRKQEILKSGGGGEGESCSLPILLCLNKMTTQSQMQTVIKYNPGLKYPYCFVWVVIMTQ